MEVRFTDRFQSDYRRLIPELQVLTDKALAMFVENPRHPSLHVKKMQPQRLGIWEGRINRGFRFTFWIDKKSGIYWLLRVGPHGILSNPK